ncbi:hypothetical protein [Pseudorhodobacter sp. MZDSW-24AT]|uniref:hypothetical protein n=1 Tax=Pseudorhodobacter sp. MZDSW-24AT TaxID=2052957 RepID=UPI000C1E086F|nr:hypothetical protein [Pseudorhodobacter sp. MZDSW-24AT]PJF08653.1 hypothetical protein CUR21_14695 [Pseudorhodobacter sp. MZDSW-24AT]
MHTLADTRQLALDGIITEEQARLIDARAREAMVAMGINTLLGAGILAATLGTIFWLASASAVALFGSVLLAAGLLILARGGALYRMFGNAGALIGAGMLIGGAGIELVDKHFTLAPIVMLPGGALVALIAGRALLRGGLTTRFVQGAILLMGLALHLAGLTLLLEQTQVTGPLVALSYAYTAFLLVVAGWATDVRLVTALALVPFAQMLSTGTSYFHASYVFMSPEPTLSILQMGLLVAAMIWLGSRVQERTARHSRILATIGFIVANLCALVGSLWGDVVGETLWGPGYDWASDQSYEAYEAARQAFEAKALVISADAYAILWAIALVAIIAWAAQSGRRALFNASMTFAAIHAYTQMFESFADEPLAYVIGGFAAIPLAWGMWRLNLRLAARSA